MHVVAVPPDGLFQALADLIRIRIVRLLADAGKEACLCELMDALLEPDVKLSRHLKILRQAGMLLARKEGRWVYHRLPPEPPPYLKQLYTLARTLPDADGIYAADLDRFQARLALREGGRCLIGSLVYQSALKAD